MCVSSSRYKPYFVLNFVHLSNNMAKKVTGKKLDRESAKTICIHIHITRGIIKTSTWSDVVQNMSTNIAENMHRLFSFAMDKEMNTNASNEKNPNTHMDMDVT